MNNFRLWAQGSRWYEELSVIDNMNNFWSYAQGYKSYEQLKVRAQDAINNSWL